jgi:hypothetical protein
MRLVRTAIACLATFAVLLTGAWAGGACAPARAQAGRPPRASLPDAFPSGRESAEIPVADALVVNGQPIQLSVLYTADSPEQVAGFYAAAFRARGLLPIANGDARLGHVSVFDPTDGLQRSVTALLERSGNTLVLLGLSDPRHLARLVSRASGAPFPVPEEHRAFLASSSEDGNVRAYSGQFVSSLTTGQVADFYRERLGGNGYTERSAQSGGGFLVFTKSGSTVSIALQPLEERGGSAAFVNHTETAR